MFKINENAPSLKNHMNRGGRFTEWRHTCTNYDVQIKKLSNKEYTKVVYDWGVQMVESLNSIEHKREVASWVLSKVQK